ncbi:MAG TPA: FhaA domain-containing protein [Acidimicrobiia bacterium]
MKLARQIEQRLEQALDGLAGRIFRGDLHPSELSARLARAAEMAEFETPAGPGTANRYDVAINPRHLAGSPEALEKELASALTVHAAERGWRLEGPVLITIRPDGEVSTGTASCSGSVAPGDLPVWGRLRRGNQQPLDLRHNRLIIGRSASSDVVVPEPEISRHHALIYRQDGETYVVDFDSANGTAVDGVPVGRSSRSMQAGSILTLAGIDFRFNYA